MFKSKNRSGAIAALAFSLQVITHSPASAIDLETAIWYYEQKDHVAAFLDFQILAAEGDSTAMTYMGQMYRRGQAVAKDFEKAEVWLRKGADLGDPMAHHRLGWMYARAEIGNDRDMESAVKHWLVAAEGGNTQAQMDLGVMYWRGEGGVEKDLSKAYAWLTAASRNTVLQAAIGNRNNLQKEMSEDQIAQGEKLAEDLIERLDSDS